MIVCTKTEYIQVSTDSSVPLNFFCNLETHFRQVDWQQKHTLTLQVSASSTNKRLVPPPINPLWENYIHEIIVHNIGTQQCQVTVSYFNGSQLMDIWKQTIQPGITRCMG